MADEKYGNSDCETYRDFRELLARDDIDAVLIATGPNWHATASMHAAKAGKDMYCEKPCTKNIAQSLALAETMRRTGRVFQAGTQRRNLPHFAFACELARTGKLGKLKTVYAHPAGMTTMHERLAARRSPSRPRKRSTGTCTSARPPGDRSTRSCSTVSTSRRAAAWSAAACWNGARTASISANGPPAPTTPRPIEYNPPEDGQRRRHATPTASKLIIREDGWLPLGSCPVRFEGETGWVEAGDSGKLVLSSPELLAGRKVAEIGGYPATFHVRDFLDCVKTRSQPQGQRRRGLLLAHRLPRGRTSRSSSIAKVKYDLAKHEFIGDEQANRLRSEAIRAPWRI